MVCPQSGVEEWDIAFERLQKTNVASERRKLMYGLAGIPEPWILNRYGIRLNSYSTLFFFYHFGAFLSNFIRFFNVDTYNMHLTTRKSRVRTQVQCSRISLMVIPLDDILLGTS